MNALIYLLSGLVLISTLGYANGRFRQRVAIWGHPPDLMLGLLGFVVFLPLVLQGYSAWWTSIPLLLAGTGLGAFVHVICTGKGAKARPPELPRVIYGVELMNYCYAQIAAIGFKPQRDEFYDLARRNAMSAEAFNEWAKTKAWK
jgi:hypothetical protein